jgi:hypothetical protein
MFGADAPRAAKAPVVAATATADFLAQHHRQGHRALSVPLSTPASNLSHGLLLSNAFGLSFRTDSCRKRSALSPDSRTGRTGQFSKKRGCPSGPIRSASLAVGRSPESGRPERALDDSVSRTISRKPDLSGFVRLVRSGEGTPMEWTFLGRTNSFGFFVRLVRKVACEPHEFAFDAD